MSWVTAGLVTLAAVIGAVCVRHFTEWFRPPPLRIIAQVRPLPPHLRGDAETERMVFAFDREQRLTSVKLFPLHTLLANPDAVPVWCLQSDSNSVPVAALTYGQEVPGMRRVSMTLAQAPLKPDIDYRLIVQTVDQMGQVDFRAQKPASAATAR